MAMSTLEALAYPLDPALTSADIIVLRNLLSEISARGTKEAAAFSGLDHDDETSIKLLEGLSDEQSESFRPTVFTGWDQDHLQRKLPAFIYMNVLLPYIDWAQGIVRKPTDVVFLTHVIIYLCTLLPSAVWLFVRFSWPHAICHWCMVIYSCGPFTIMLHNHIHNNGVLNRNYAWLDQSFPYLLEPLMGHTWDSYYFHHVKHHHVEGNGPDDLSSTIRYQRDDLIDFLTYVVRFLAFIWVELPLYFLRKGKQELAIRSFVSEMVSYTAIYMLAGINLRAAMFVLLVPLLQTRIGMMIGNWGQHALVDDIEPNSDFRSSITLFDVPSNRHCFNDGYHTSHHLNPLRHWRDHPLSFLKAKRKYKNERALVFRNIDYLMITIKLMQKDYAHLARCLVPIGDQINMNQDELANMLRSKTRKFTEEDIRKNFPRSRT